MTSRRRESLTEQRDANVGLTASQNIGWSARLTAARWQTSASENFRRIPVLLQFDVVDKDGKPIPPSPTAGSGGDVGSAWITIPYDSTVRLRANPGGWGKPADPILALPLRPMQGRYRVFRERPASDYFLTAKLTISPPSEDTIEHRDDWPGTLEFPTTKLVFKKP
jgi:hypothetical protein